MPRVGKKTPPTNKRKRVASISTGGGKTRSALEVMMMAPQSKVIVRIQDGIQTKPTAAVSLHARERISWSLATGFAAPAGGTPLLQQTVPFTDFAFAMFRDYLRCAIIHRRNPQGGVAAPGNIWAYRWLATLNTTATETAGAAQVGDNAGNFALPGAVPSTELRIMEFIEPSAAVPTTIAGLATSTFTPHGTFMFAGKDGLRKGIWCDSNGSAGTVSEIIVTANANMPAATTLTCFRWQAGWRKYAVGVLAVAGTTFTFALVDPGYYALGDMAIPTGNLATVFTVQQRSNTDSWGHVCLPQLAANPSNITSVMAGRILGFSSLFANRTAEQYKAGTIVCEASEEGETWMEYLIAGNVNTNTNNMVNAALAEEDSFQFPAANGNYGFGKLTEIEDVKWRKELQFDDPSEFPLSSAFQIIDPAPFYTVMTTISQQVDGGLPDFLLEMAFAFEFHTQNQWFEQHLPQSTLSDLEAAAKKMADIPQFMGNVGELC